MECATLDEATLAAADCVVIATDHASYDWGWVAQHARLIVDTRNATRDLGETGATIIKL